MSFIILFGIIHKSHYTIKLTFTFIYSIYILLVSMYILIYYFKKKWGGGVDFPQVKVFLYPWGLILELLNSHLTKSSTNL